MPCCLRRRSMAEMWRGSSTQPLGGYANLGGAQQSAMTCYGPLQLCVVPRWHATPSHAKTHRASIAGPQLCTPCYPCPVPPSTLRTELRCCSRQAPNLGQVQCPCATAHATCCTPQVARQALAAQGGGDIATRVAEWALLECRALTAASFSAGTSREEAAHARQQQLHIDVLIASLQLALVQGHKVRAQGCRVRTCSHLHPR